MSTEEGTVRLNIGQWQDSWGHENFRALGKKQNIAPKILFEYKDDDGVRMYSCEGDRHFIADTYDLMFVPKHNKKMRSRYAK